jgi:hypothetical protein
MNITLGGVDVWAKPQLAVRNSLLGYEQSPAWSRYDKESVADQGMCAHRVFAVAEVNIVTDVNSVATMTPKQRKFQ